MPLLPAHDNFNNGLEFLKVELRKHRGDDTYTRTKHMRRAENSDEKARPEEGKAPTKIGKKKC